MQDVEFVLAFCSITKLAKDVRHKISSSTNGAERCTAHDLDLYDNEGKMHQRAVVWS